MNLKRILFFIFLSFGLVALAQPDWSSLCCVLTAAFGYALFWKGILEIPSKAARFLIATLWFAAVQLCHLNWFMADRYVGAIIYVFLIAFVLILGLFFALFSSLALALKKNVWNFLALASVWTLFEWGRLFLLSGFSWNPIGYSLTATVTSLQLASLFGVFGLTFWVIFTNFFALKWLLDFAWRRFLIWIVIALIPYFFGVSHLAVQQKKVAQKPGDVLNVLLVQNALYPEEKISLNRSSPLPPHVQWEKLLQLIAPHAERPVDLIVFSEAVVPYGTHIPIYAKEDVDRAFISIFDRPHLFSDASLLHVGNHYWAQALSNLFNSDVIIGLEDYEFREENSPLAYNAAFLFRPFKQEATRYEKRVLVPLGEYIPFNWCKKILSKYGIEDSFTPGEKNKLMEGTQGNYGVSICYEETYGHLVRESKKGGASLLVNLSNDVWYPKSRLPFVHFQHGRIRSVETGLPLVRACNTGITCGVDCLGRVIGMLKYETKNEKARAEALYLNIPLHHYKTFYELFGDLPLMTFSMFLIIGKMISSINRNYFAFNYLKTFRLRKNEK